MKSRIACAVVAAVALGSAQTGSLQTFEALRVVDLVQGQARLRPVGANAGSKSLVLSAAAEPPDTDAQVALVSPAELKAVIDAAAGMEAVKASRPARLGMVSFSLFTSVRDSGAFEVVLDAHQARTLVAKLHAALSGNLAARKSLGRFACAIGGAGPLPADVTAQVPVEFSGLRLNRATGRFVGTVTIRNNGTHQIEAPVAVAINVAGKLDVHGADGFSCGSATDPVPFLTVSDAPLAPGASATSRVEFVNPDREPMRPSARVLAGGGVSAR